MIPAILAEDFSGFPQFFMANSGTVPRLGDYNSFQILSNSPSFTHNPTMHLDMLLILRASLNNFRCISIFRITAVDTQFSRQSHNLLNSTVSNISCHVYPSNATVYNGFRI
jgi:hypothetical protein